MIKLDIPIQCTQWPRVGMFGSKEFGSPELIKPALDAFRLKRVVILAGVNGIVAETIRKILGGSLLPRLVVIAPDLEGITPGNQAEICNRTIAADELMLQTADQLIAFDGKSQNTHNMLMSNRLTHKKPIQIIEDPKLPKRQTLVERISERHARAAR